MSVPRRVLPGSTYLVTRRCVERRFFLLPSAAVNSVFLYCLAVAAARWGVKIHAFCVLSDHYHLVLTDILGELPKFMEWLNGTLARFLNAYYERGGYFWDAQKYNRVDLQDPHDMLSKMAYTLVNPVAAGLVSEGAQWPGVRSGTLLGGARRLTVRRPEFFFQKEGELPEEIELVVEPPAAVVKLQGGSSGRLLEDAVTAREREIREQFRRAGRRFLGRQGILRQQPTDAASRPERRGQLKPQVAARDKGLRKALLAAVASFLAEYREAFRKFKSGVREVIFPAGTYWMRVHCGVICRDPPEV